MRHLRPYLALLATAAITMACSGPPGSSASGQSQGGEQQRPQYGLQAPLPPVEMRARDSMREVDHRHQEQEPERRRSGQGDGAHDQTVIRRSQVHHSAKITAKARTAQ